MTDPLQIPLFGKDIRKLPKLMGKREANLINSSFASQSTTPNMSASGTSDSGNGDTTAVEDSRPNRVTIVDQLQTPPLSSFKKKRTRSYAAAKPKYWNEFDNPSDSDGEDAYVLFIDPNAESAFTKTWHKLQNLFSRKSGSEEQSLLHNGSAEEGMSSSDDETLTSRRNRTQRSYGAFDGAAAETAVTHEGGKSFWLPPITMTCLGASLTIVIVGYILAMTGRKKQAREVDAGIIFAVVSSLLFAISGVASMFGLGRSTVWAARWIALAVLAVDAVASGALLAWMLA